MAQPSKVQHLHLQGVFSLLDDLQAGFALIDPDGKLVYTSDWLRRLLPRRAIKGSGLELLGPALYAELCAPVLDGESPGQRWREIEFEDRDEGVNVQVRACSRQVEFAGGRHGALLSLDNVCSEVGLHEQEQINANLRHEIARQLREHEDDISQLNEILQLAPAIFASFMAEAGSAIAQVEAVMASGPTSERLTSTLRELHTLKGNARSLGLNFIGGRAHSLEEFLVHMRNESGAGADEQALGDLADLLEDLRRARTRASFVRSRLRNAASQPTIDVQQHATLDQAHTALRAALAALPADSPAHEYVLEAATIVRAASQIKLQELFEFLKAAVAKVSAGSAADCPVVDTTGGELTIGPATFSALSAALPHLVRNAVSHGIESAEERLLAGKSALGFITIDANRTSTALELCIGDDGRGIDANRLRAIAAEQGIPAHDDIAAILLHPGVSTASVVDEDKGRGMGSTAARHAIASVGGTIAITSEAGKGTTFSIRVPHEHV